MMIIRLRSDLLYYKIINTFPCRRKTRDLSHVLMNPSISSTTIDSGKEKKNLEEKSVIANAIDQSQSSPCALAKWQQKYRSNPTLKWKAVMKTMKTTVSVPKRPTTQTNQNIFSWRMKSIWRRAYLWVPACKTMTTTTCVTAVNDRHTLN